MPFKKAALALALVLTAAPLAAKEQKLVLDADATTVAFTLGSTLHTVHGTMRLERGEILFDDAAGTASGTVVIDAASAETGNEKRDRKMHEKVLESGRFPEIVFSATAFEGELPASGAGSIVLPGTVSVHGEAKPLRLEAAIERSGSAVTATFDVSIPYVAWGMKDPSVFILRADKEVRVEVEAHGTLEAGP